MKMKIDQSNAYYNYTLGFAITDIDLLKTAKIILNSGLSQAIFFSDLKCIYNDDRGNTKVELVQLEGREWDANWKVNLSSNLPQKVKTILFNSLELWFHEHRIQGHESDQLPFYIRAELPPIVLESDKLTLPLYAWIKVFCDGIVILSYQLDTTWSGIDEEFLISTIVNLFKEYFNFVWIDARIQRLDANQVLPNAFSKEMSIVGQAITGRKTKKLLKKMLQESKATLDEDLSKEGRKFEFDNDQWILHKVAGSDQQKDWEATIDMCRSQYTNAIESLIVPNSRRIAADMQDSYIWQGRPSISLMRYHKQPSSKDRLLMEFGTSLSRILIRSPHIDKPPSLPPDLRLFEDYCFHGNRSLLLWTWLRSKGEPDNAWESQNTRTKILENQARAEHFEYYNMKVARACAIVGSSPHEAHLIEAYERLTSAEDMIHHSSQAGEISDALSYLISAVGTADLIPPAKERARFKLDLLRYQEERRRTRTERWIGFVFGIVGVVGLAELIAKPFVLVKHPEISNWLAGLCSFLLVVLFVGLLILLGSLLFNRYDH
jgi:hypothetical protein